MLASPSRHQAEISLTIAQHRSIMHNNAGCASQLISLSMLALAAEFLLWRLQPILAGASAEIISCLAWANAAGYQNFYMIIVVI